MRHHHFIGRRGGPWARERGEAEHGGHHGEGPGHHGGPEGPGHHGERPGQHWPRGGPEGPGRHFGHWGKRWFGRHGGGRPGPPFGRGGPGGDPFGEDGGGRRRHRRGDIKFVLLELLGEQPRHGYDLIKALEQRYGGFYRPSPGSIYPTLQLLEDEGHLTSDTVDGKRIYTLTDSGRQLLAERQRQEESGDSPRRHSRPMRDERPELDELRRVTEALVAGVTQVAQHGTAEQIRAAAALLDTARREVYGILAQDSGITRS